MIVEGIYVTLGAKQLVEKPYKSQVKDFLRCDGEEAVFYWKMHIKPTKKFTTVYIVIGNKVRWKARFVSYEGERVVELDDGRILDGKLFMLLIDFEKLPKPYEHKKGFQGIRYKH